MTVNPKLRINDKDIEAAVRELQGANKGVATIGLAAGASNVMTATIQLTDAFGNNIAERRRVEFYMTTDAEGDNVTASAYSGSLTVTTGTQLVALTAKKHVVALSDANGAVVFTITDTAKPATERVAVVNPDGSLSISAVSGANWGA